MMTRPATESTADTQSFFSEGRDIRRRGLEIMTTLININQTNVSSSALLSSACCSTGRVLSVSYWAGENSEEESFKVQKKKHQQSGRLIALFGSIKFPEVWCSWVNSKWELWFENVASGFGLNPKTSAKALREYNLPYFTKFLWVSAYWIVRLWFSISPPCQDILFNSRPCSPSSSSWSEVQPVKSSLIWWIKEKL